MWFHTPLPSNIQVTGPLKTCSGLEPVLRCEPSTYQPLPHRVGYHRGQCSGVHTACMLFHTPLPSNIQVTSALKNNWVGAGTEMQTHYLPATAGLVNTDASLAMYIQHACGFIRHFPAIYRLQGPLKTCSGLEPVPICEPTTYQPLLGWLSQRPV